MNKQEDGNEKIKRKVITRTSVGEVLSREVKEETRPGWVRGAC